MFGRGAFGRGGYGHTEIVTGWSATIELSAGVTVGSGGALAAAMEVRTAPGRAGASGGKLAPQLIGRPLAGRSAGFGGALKGAITAAPGERYLAVRDLAYGRSSYGRGGNLEFQWFPSNTSVWEARPIHPTIEVALQASATAARGAAVAGEISAHLLPGFTVGSGRPLPRRPKVSISLFD